MPGFIAFLRSGARDKAPEGKEWIHEIKTDGYRAQVHISLRQSHGLFALRL